MNSDSSSKTAGVSFTCRDVKTLCGLFFVLFCFLSSGLNAYPHRVVVVSILQIYCKTAQSSSSKVAMLITVLNCNVLIFCSLCSWLGVTVKIQVFSLVVC